VVTFVDITELKEVMKKLKERTALSEGVIQTIREPLLILDGKLKVVSANPSFYNIFDVSPRETEGISLYDLGNGQWNIPGLRTLMENILPQNTKVEDFMVEHEFQRIGHRKMLLNARRIVLEDMDTQNQFILLAIEDVTNRKEPSPNLPGGGMNHEAGSRWER
jgi:two-component system CheB/CheR fusion protein